ncbi:MAG TPA: hypothetical protein VHM20_07070, partial [Gammaproteobacteria bacterium]|nr:hypothetical protein [Gammaproteobacteria bacterium]
MSASNQKFSTESTILTLSNARKIKLEDKKTEQVSIDDKEFFIDLNQRPLDEQILYYKNQLLNFVINLPVNKTTTYFKNLSEQKELLNQVELLIGILEKPIYKGLGYRESADEFKKRKTIDVQ